MYTIRNSLAKVFKKQPDINGAIEGVRSLRHPAPDMTVYMFPSKKAGGTLCVEGSLERATVVLLEMSEDVKSIRSQPVEIQLSSKHFAVPDFAVLKADGTYQIVEVKPSIKSLTENQVDRFHALESLLLREGIDFKLVDKTQLPSESVVQRLMGFYCIGHRALSNTALRDIAIDALSQSTYESMSSLYKALEEEQLPRHLAEYLVFHQQIKTKDTEWLVNTKLYL